ncbi:hypothetical protein V8F44DRAFT_597696, partial [Aspergillus fumigatus]
MAHLGNAQAEWNHIRALPHRLRVWGVLFPIHCRACGVLWANTGAGPWGCKRNQGKRNETKKKEPWINQRNKKKKKN